MGQPLHLFTTRHGTQSALNNRLIAQQKLTPHEIEIILALHVEREAIEAKMDVVSEQVKADPTESNRAELKVLYEAWIEQQVKLQAAWKFDANPDFFPFFTVPRCSCPKMDNGGRLGTPYHIYDGDCIYHGINGVLNEPWGNA